jgi:hypothetical protein
MVIMAAIALVIMMMLMLMMVIMTAIALVIMMMLMLTMVIMTAIALVIMVVMLVLVVVIVTAIALVIMVVMLMVMMMAASAIALVIMVVMLMVMMMAASAVAVIVMVMMLMSQTLQLGFDGVLALHCLQQLCAGKLTPGGDNYGSRCIMLADQRNTLLNLGIRHAIGVAQNDASCVFDLIIEKLTEVLHIHLALVGIDYGSKAIQNGIASILLNALYRADNITQLADTGRLDQNAVGVVLVQRLLQRSAKIANQAAADTAGVHFSYFNTCVLHKAAVNADLAEFVLNQHQLFVLICFAEHFLDQCGFTCSQKAGKNINLGHLLYPLFL